MAPTTRARTSGEPSNTKKRVAVDVEDDDSSEEIEEIAPKRKPKKRAKLDQAAEPAAKKSTTSGGRAKKRGRLNALPEMPLDILEEIFSQLDPGDLIRIARTNKAFRRLLLAGNQFSHIWKTSWSRMEGYPTCPEDVSLLKWLQLLFGGPYCQVCAAPSVQRVFFGIRARMCKNCLHKSLVFVGSTWVETIRPHQLDEYIPIVNEGRSKYAYAEDLENLKATIAFALEDVNSGPRHQALATVIGSLKDAFAPRIKFFFPGALLILSFQHRRECESWQSRITANHKEDIGERRSNRREDIVRRLEGLDYTRADAHGIWRLKDVNVSKPLTDRAWSILLPTLIPTLDHARDMRHESDRLRRRHRRLDAAEKAYVEALRSGVAKPQDIPYLPRPGSCTQFGSLPALLDEDEVEISEDWRQRLEVAFNDALPLMQDAFEKHRIEFASLLMGDSNVEPPDPLRVLSLATSALVVRDRYGSRSVCFGLEAIAWASTQMYNTRSDELYSDSRLLRVVQPTPEHVGKAVRVVLRLLGLDETSTILDLDTLDPCFTCTTCPVRHDPYYVYHEGVPRGLRYRSAMNWRIVVEHLYHSHENGTDNVQLHLLTSSERAAIGAEGSAVAIRRQQRAGYGLMVESFACCHCVSIMVRKDCREYQYMALDAVRLHVKQCHVIENVREGIDFFKNPLGNRGVLGGVCVEYCRVEEKKPEETADAAASTESTA
ncbi:hypothetical protein PENSPDRAFT_688593 [Peniophora sp. CONT]|nr:hypothetical protein PENSPDRAFT_688593 [Peniophora sp. CONT]